MRYIPKALTKLQLDILKVTYTIQIDLINILNTHLHNIYAIGIQKTNTNNRRYYNLTYL